MCSTYDCAVYDNDTDMVYDNSGRICWLTIYDGISFLMRLELWLIVYKSLSSGTFGGIDEKTNRETYKLV